MKSPNTAMLKPRSSKQVRKLKVSASYRRNRYSHTLVPHIRLCGQWLEANGYQPGGTVEIEIRDNELIIRKAA